MKKLFVIMFFVSGAVEAQDTVGLRKATASLNRALLHQDTALLKQLVADDISYGHSNGWLQSKKDIVADFVSGKIVYTKIENGEEYFNIHPQAVTVRSITKVEGVVSGTAFNMSLQILQVWKRIKKQWTLIARQSVKVSG